MICTETRVPILLAALCTLCYAQIDGYPQVSVPSQVLSVANDELMDETNGEGGTVGTPVRFFNRLPCDSLQQVPERLAAFLNNSAETGRSEWYVPIYVDDVLHGIMEVVRYPGKDKFRYAGYHPASYLGLSIVEINDYWVKQRGYHPVIIECGYNTMLHIPELGPNNLTHFATTVLPRDQAPGVRKCKFHKWDIENGVSGSGDEAWEEYVRQSKGETKKEGLAKILAAPSDFTTVDSLETGIEWLKNNRSGKR